MKKRIAYILATAVLTGAAFFVGNYQSAKADTNTRSENFELVEITNTSTGAELTYTDGKNFYNFWIPEETLEENGLINVYAVKGWEHWENAEEVGLEIGGYEITKKPYTVETTVEKID